MSEEVFPYGQTFDVTDLYNECIQEADNLRIKYSKRTPLETMRLEYEIEQHRLFYLGYYYEPELIEMYLMHGNGD